LGKRYAQLATVKLWNGVGTGCRFGMSFDSALKDFLMKQMEEARRVKGKSRRNRSVREVIKSLFARGIGIGEELLGYDAVDVVGLIGEIILENFVINSNSESILPKWRFGGTSKSRGIDLVARKRVSEQWELILYEVKHSHDEVRNSKPELCHNLIKRKFKIGLDELAYEKTKWNLTNIIMWLDDLITRGEALKLDVSPTKEHRHLISTGLVNDRYEINVVVAVDAKYCGDTTFNRSVSGLPNPVEVGENHLVTLTLLESTLLEKATDEVCDNFVGAL